MKKYVIALAAMLVLAVPATASASGVSLGSVVKRLDRQYSMILGVSAHVRRLNRIVETRNIVHTIRPHGVAPGTIVDPQYANGNRCTTGGINIVQPDPRDVSICFPTDNDPADVDGEGGAPGLGNGTIQACVSKGGSLQLDVNGQPCDNQGHLPITLVIQQ